MVSISGCLHSDESYATLQRLDLLNVSEAPIATELRIERADTGDVVYEESYDLDPERGTLVDCVWPDAPLYVKTRRADGDEWNSYDTTGNEGCLQLLSRVDEHGTAFLRHYDECPVRSPTCHVDVGE